MRWWIVALFGVVGCVAPVDDEETATSGAALSQDGFACFRPESTAEYTCSGSPNLTFSTLCKEGEEQSWHVSMDDDAQDATMAVIAPHGGSIERGSDVIALALSKELHLRHYVFVAHPTDTCRRKYPTLHITSIHFNDARAERIMRNVNRGLGVHGQGRANKICVGGATPALRGAFLRAYRDHAQPLSPSATPAVIATENDDCDGIEGTARANISNRSATGAGLQLELGSAIRSDLVASLSGDRRFWVAFRNAVRSACRVDLGGVRGCS